MSLLSYSEFLRNTLDHHAEWHDGHVVFPGTASEKHQLLLSFLNSLFGLFVQLRGLGRVYPAPFQMRLARSGREPDLLFVHTNHLDRLKNTYLDGPADLVVEIVSPESVGRDRGEKFYEYAEGGVPEYWLLDPQHERAEFYQLDGRGGYQLIRLHDGVYQSRQLPGLWIDPNWLWQDPLSSPLRTLAEIAGVDMSLVEALERALGQQE